MLTNAAGGVNFDFHPGDLMLITDQITTAVPSPDRTEYRRTGRSFSGYE